MFWLVQNIILKKNSILIVLTQCDVVSYILGHLLRKKEYNQSTM
jgi:hypothetical protein